LYNYYTIMSQIILIYRVRYLIINTQLYIIIIIYYIKYIIKCTLKSNIYLKITLFHNTNWQYYNYINFYYKNYFVVDNYNNIILVYV